MNEPFFSNNKYYDSVESLIDEIVSNDCDIEDLPYDYGVKATKAQLLPIIQYKADDLLEMADEFSIDCNKLNNSIDNLEWCSRNHNTKHAWENGLYTNFTNKNVICTETHKEWKSVKAAATELGIRPQTLARMLRGERTNNTTLIYKQNQEPSTTKER